MTKNGACESGFSPYLHPRSTLPPDAQPSERKVHAALVPALPAGWSAWHSLKLRNAAGEFAEGDFVIADPEHGILVLEVKGGIVRKRDGVWFQNVYSGRKRTVIPVQSGHRFRLIPATIWTGPECEATSIVPAMRSGPSSTGCCSIISSGSLRSIRAL